MRTENIHDAGDDRLIAEKLRLLVVEDNDNDYRLLLAELKRSRIEYDAVRVETRKDFDQQLRKFNPDVVISDYTLPRFNGLEALRMVQEFNPIIPFIITTGSINEETAVACIKAGATDYVLKDNITRIGSAIKSALVLKKQKEENEQNQKELRKLSSAVRQTADSVVITDRSGIIEYVNPAFERNTGYSRAEALGKTPAILKSGIHNQEMYATLWKTILSGMVFHGEFVNKKKNGEIYYQDETITPILDANGHVTHFVSTGRDITQRKRAERAIEESEKKYRDLVDTMSEGLGVQDKDGTITFMNNRACTMLGYTLEELMGRPIEVLFDPKNQAIIQKQMSKRQKGVRQSFEVSWLRKDGTTIDTILAPSPVFDEHGTYTGSVAVFTDITERKKSEEALRQSEFVIRESQRVGRIGSYVTDFAAGFWESSEVLDEIFGIDGNYVRSVDGWKNLIHPEDRAEMDGYLNAVIATKEPFNRDYRIVRKNDGEVRWVSGHGELTFDEHGKLLKMIGTIQDVTERKRTEEALHESKERLLAVLKSAPIVLIALDKDGIFTISEGAGLERTGLRAGEVVGQSGFALYKDLPIVEPNGNIVTGDAVIRRVLAGEEVAGLTELNGVVFDNNFVPLMNKDRHVDGLVGVAIDVTDRKRAEKALRKAKDFAEEVIRTANVIFLQLDLAGNVVRLNPAAEEITGYTQEELEGTNWFSRLVPRERFPEVWEEFKKITLEGRIPEVYENPVIAKDGTERQILWKNSVLKEDEKIFGSISFGVDITERKRAEQALKDSASSFSSLFNTTTDGMIIHENGVIVEVNKSLGVLAGYTTRELAGMKVADLVAVESRPLVLRNLQEGYEQPFEAVGKTKSGKMLSVELTTTGISYHGRLARLTNVRDISERKKAERALRQSEERFSTVFSASPIGISISTIEDGRFIDANTAYLSIYGYTREEAIGKTSSELNMLVDATTRATIVQMLKEEHRIHNLEFEIRKKSGEVRSAVFSAEIIVLGGTECLLGMTQDITERKQAEEGLVQSAESFWSLFNAASDGMVLSDNGILIKANSQFAVMFGYALDELPGRNVTEFSPPEFADTISKKHRERATATYEIVGRRRDASIFPMEVSPVYIAFEGRRVRLTNFRDITERKNNLNALRESEERFRTIYESSPIGITRVSPHGNFVSANRSLVRMLGYSEEELCLKSFNDITYGEDRDVGRKELKELVEGRKDSTEFEKRYVRKDGTIIWAHLTIAAVRDSTGALLYTVSLVEDITHRRHAEERIRQQAALLDITKDAVVVRDRLHNILFWNKGAETMYGWSAGEVMGKNVLDILYTDPGSKEKFQKAAQSTLQAGEWRGEFLHTTRDGVALIVDSQWTLMPDNDGMQSSILVVNTDITARRQAEERIRLLAYAVRSINQSVSITDLDNHLTFVNDAFLKSYGYTEEEVLGKSVSLATSPRNPASISREILTATLAGGWNGELINRRKDGSEFPVLLSTSVIKSEQGEPIALIGVATDLTEEKKSEERQRSLEAQLAQAQKMEAIGTLAGGIAHDFNNILGIILGHLSIVTRPDYDASLRANSADTIAKAVQRGAAMVRQILTFARKTTVAREPINVNHFIDEMTKMLREMFPKTIEISIEPDPRDLIITADQTQFQQALMNLCINARDAMMDPTVANLGAGTLKIRTTKIPGKTVRERFPDATASEYISISVSDTGTGMDEATKQKIFEPFFTTKELGKGTGLGLAVVYGVITSMHGHVDVFSAVGKGTTFTLFLPSTSSYVAETTASTVHPSEMLKGNETVLVVEDEEGLLALMKVALERYGYTVLTAKDGVEAIQQFEKNQKTIAVVLTDVGLPKLDGKELFSRLNSIVPGVKVIFASGYHEPEYKSELIKAGARDFVQKPYLPDEVMKKIREVLDHK